MKTNNYRCPLCKKIIKCKSDKKWIKSVCEKSGEATTRIILVKPKVRKKL